MSIRFQPPPQLRSHGFPFGKSEVNSGYAIKVKVNEARGGGGDGNGGRSTDESSASESRAQKYFLLGKSTTPLQSARPSLDASVGFDGKTLTLSTQLHWQKLQLPVRVPSEWQRFYLVIR